MTNPIEGNEQDETSPRPIKVLVGVAIGLALIVILCLALGVPTWVVALGIGAFVLFVVFEG